MGSHLWTKILNYGHRSLSTYRRCKYAFYLEHVLGVKSPQSAVMMYGTAMHAVAEYCVQQLLAGIQPSVEVRSRTAVA